MSWLSVVFLSRSFLICRIKSKIHFFLDLLRRAILYRLPIFILTIGNPDLSDFVRNITMSCVYVDLFKFAETFSCVCHKSMKSSNTLITVEVQIFCEVLMVVSKVSRKLVRFLAKPCRLH